MKEKYKELLVARYYVEHVKSVQTAAEEICDEESVGTWTKLTTIENTEIDIIPRLRAEILDTKVHADHDGYQSGEVLIGFKTETFDIEAGRKDRNPLLLFPLKIFGSFALSSSFIFLKSELHNSKIRW